MISQFRQEEILGALSEKNIVYLKDLSAKLGVSESTIRRDLQKMSKTDNVELLRGGAVRLQRRRIDIPVQQMNNATDAAKEIIMRKAAAVVEDGDMIYIDSGTTTGGMIRYLEGKKVTVITTGLSVLQWLPITGVECILIGGQVDSSINAITGPQVTKTMENMYFDKAFLSISGYTASGIFANDLNEAHKKEIAKEHAYQTYLMADTSKENQWGFLKIMEPEEGILITEKPDEPAMKE